MMKLTTFAAATLLGLSATLPATLAHAESHAMEGGPEAREKLMKSIGGAMQTVGGMAQGKVAFDAEAAQAALDQMEEDAAMIPAVFESDEMSDDSRATPAIWENWDDFVAKAEALQMAAADADASSAETLGASMRALGGACQACHQDYRAPEN